MRLISTAALPWTEPPKGRRLVGGDDALDFFVRLEEPLTKDAVYGFTATGHPTVSVASEHAINAPLASRVHPESVESLPLVRNASAESVEAATRAADDGAVWRGARDEDGHDELRSLSVAASVPLSMNNK